MTTPTAPRRASPQRARGERAGLTLDEIVAVARALPPARLTMQAIADAMGVDRKAISHHVTDRDTLLRLVAWDAFSSSLGDVAIEPHEEWPEACRVFALAVADATIELGELADHLDVEGPVLVRWLDLTESVLARLVDAGLDDRTAVRTLVLLANTAMSFGRDHVRVRTGSRGLPSRPALVRAGLVDSDQSRFPHLRRIIGEGIDTYAPEQLELGIALLTAGIRAELDAVDP